MIGKYNQTEQPTPTERGSIFKFDVNLSTCFKVKTFRSVNPFIRKKIF